MPIKFWGCPRCKTLVCIFDVYCNKCGIFLPLPKAFDGSHIREWLNEFLEITINIKCHKQRHELIKRFTNFKFCETCGKKL